MAEEKTPAPQTPSEVQNIEGLNLDALVSTLPPVILGGKQYKVKPLEPEVMVKAIKISKIAKRLTDLSSKEGEDNDEAIANTIKELGDSYSDVITIGCPGLVEEHPEITFAMKQAVVQHIIKVSSPKDRTTTEKSQDTTSSGSSQDSAKSSQDTK